MGHTPPAVRNPDVYPVPVDDRGPGGIIGNPHIRPQFPADDGSPREVFPAPALPHKTPGLGQFVGCHPPGYSGLVHRRLYEECLSHRSLQVHTDFIDTVPVHLLHRKTDVVRRKDIALAGEVAFEFEHQPGEGLGIALYVGKGLYEGRITLEELKRCLPNA